MNAKEYLSKLDAEARWEALRSYYRSSSKGKASMAALANRCGSSWFDSRANDTPEHFIAYTWHRMTNLRGFGKKKLRLLMEILVSNVDIEAFHEGSYVADEPQEPLTLEIDGWDSFPLALSFCSARTRALFETVSLKTPKDLIEWYAESGERGVLAQGNAGRKTLIEIQQIHGGWTNCDLSKLQALLPIDEQLRFTLHGTILGHYSRLSEDYQAVLSLRLVEAHTLEECGSTLKKTRERVRQIEKLLLSNLELALDYFSEERELLFNEWQATGQVPCPNSLPEDHQKIYKGAIRNYFERSDEGKETIAQNEQEVESTIQEIREQWDYYTSGLELGPFLSGKGQAALKEQVLEAGHKKGHFSYDVSTDRVTATKALLKHAALACLKNLDQSEWIGSDWLLKLKESPRFREVDLTHLSHLYRSWKSDPQFQAYTVDFSAFSAEHAVEQCEEEFEAKEKPDVETEPTAEESPQTATEDSAYDRIKVIRDIVLSSTNTTPESPLDSPNRRESAKDNEARKFDLLIRSAIEEAQALSSEDALLGFLNISDDDQQEILDLFRKEVNKQKPAFLIRRYPALASYALTLAAAVGLQQSEIGSGSFYLAWESSIGWRPAPSSRKQIAESYMAALKHLDLRIGSIFPDQSLDRRGGCYLFHAAVLPHFIHPLEAALKSVQRELPLPDPDEPHQIEEFAQLLANRVERGQRRLIAVLESPVGSLLVRRLVLWHMTGDSELFPPFILKMLEEQKSTEQQTIIKRPYVIFDPLEGSLSLELPAQSAKITCPNSKWLVNGHAFRADTAREPIRLSEITSAENTELTVQIEGLLRRTKNGSSELRKQNYTFQTGITEKQPFRIFREADGREVQFQTRHGVIELGIGTKYIALLADYVEIESDHESDECELGQTIEFEINLYSPALAINDGETEWIIKPKITPGIYVHRKDAQCFMAKDLNADQDVTINYGSDFGLTVALPSGIESATISFESMTAEAPCHREVVINESDDRYLTLKDLSASFSNWLKGLAPAIHQVKLLLSPYGRKPIRKTAWFWKGLSYVNQHGDMYLKEYPENTEVSGYEDTDGQLKYTTNSRQPTELSSKQSDVHHGFRLKIPKPGVDVVLSNNEGEVLETNPTQAIDILPNDTRIITFSHGGLAPIELRSGENLIGIVNTDRKSITKSLGALVARLGKTGAISAQSVHPLIEDTPQSVIHWRTPKVIKHCQAVENEDGEYHWELVGLSSLGLKRVRARLYDLAEFTDSQTAFNTVEIELPEHVEHTTETTLGNGIIVEVSLDFNDNYRFVFHYDRHRFLGQMHVVELDCLIVGESGWQQLACNEGHGRLSKLRLLFKGHKPATTEVANLLHLVFWNDLNTIGFGHDLNLNISDTSKLEQWLARARWLVNFRYPTIVWEKYNFRLKAFYRAVTRLSIDNTSEACWWQHAIAGLEEHAARKPQNATIAPCLLFGAAYAGLYPKLRDSVEPMPEANGLISRCFAEASRAVVAKNGALKYVRSAFEDKRVDIEFFSHFSTWQNLLLMNDAPLQGFSFQEWSSNLSAKVRQASFDDIKDNFTLLESDHFLECIRKLSQRSKAVDSIRSQESSHWLSRYISQLNLIADRAYGLLSQITGEPHAEFWECFESSELLLFEEGLRGLVANLIKVSCVLASIYASVNKGILTAENAQQFIAKEFGSEPNHSETLRFLIIGTSPELIAYFFLFFTYTLEPSPHR